jgi:carbon storage regulator
VLVLSRKQNETIVVGDSIEITVCRVVGGKVKLGLQAPPGMRIRRGELEAFEDRQFQLECEPLAKGG